MVFVFIDENEQSIEDGAFGLYPAPSHLWLNFPSDRHNRSANLTFADGHAQKWKWKAVKKFIGAYQTAFNADDFADLRRLQQAMQWRRNHCVLHIRVFAANNSLR